MAWFYDKISRAEPISFKWPDNARLAVCFHSPFEAWSERQDPASNLYRSMQADMPPLPPNATTKNDYTTASEHDYGGRVGVWRVLEMLKKYDLPSTFPTSGVTTERYPEAVKEIVRQGHELCAHNWEQDERAILMTRDEEDKMIVRCQDAFEKLTGQRPVGWISAGGGHTDHTPSLLVKNGFVLHGDVMNDDTPYFYEADGKTLIAIPVKRGRTGINDVHIIRGGGNARELLQRFMDEFDLLYEEGAKRPRMITAVMHMELQSAQNNKPYEEMVKYAKRSKDVWFTNRIGIAKWLGENYLPKGAQSNLKVAVPA